MIIEIDISKYSKSPNIALPHWYSFVDSPSQIRIVNCPKKIGNWQLTSYQLNVNYPNTNLFSNPFIKCGDTWSTTISACNTTGTTSKGYSIIANGTDEFGVMISSFCLGVGDVSILDDEGIVLDDDRYVMHVLSSASGRLIGDVFKVNNKWKILTLSGEDELGGGVDLSGYATQQWVKDQNYLTAHQSLSGYATEEWVENKNYLTAHLSLDGYATLTWVENKNYLTSHQSLSNHYTKPECDTKISNDISSSIVKGKHIYVPANFLTMNEDWIDSYEYVGCFDVRQVRANYWMSNNVFDNYQYALVPIETVEDLRDDKLYVDGSFKQNGNFALSIRYNVDEDISEFELSNDLSTYNDLSTRYAAGRWRETWVCKFNQEQNYDEPAVNLIERLKQFDTTLLSGETETGDTFKFHILTLND